MPGTGIGKWIRAKALADTTLTDLIGERLHPIVAPQGSPLPYCVYLTQKQPATNTKSEPADTDRVSVEFHLHDTPDNYSRLEDIDDALRAVFDYSESTDAGVKVTGAQYDSTADGLTENVEHLVKIVRYSFRVYRL